MTDLIGWSNRLYWLGCIGLVGATLLIAGGRYLQQYVAHQVDPVIAQVDEQVGLLRQDLEKQQVRLVKVEERSLEETAAVVPAAGRSSSTSAKLSAPARPTAPTSGDASVVSSAPSDAVPGGLININTATSDQLQELPGIGSSYAEKIIVGRPYAAVEDLMKVKGIGEKTFAKLRPLITVQ